MPGYKVARSAVKKTALFDKYQCPHCSCLLKLAVQPLCGHWLCESCADELLASSSPKCPRPDCQEHLKADAEGGAGAGAGTGTGAEYFPDRFVRREIEGLTIYCTHQAKGCKWEDRLATLDIHLKTCQFASYGCPHCEQTVTLDQMELHKQTCPKAMTECPLANFGCSATSPMKKDDLVRHVLENQLSHLKIIAKFLPRGQQTKNGTQLIIGRKEDIDDDSDATGQYMTPFCDATETDYGGKVKSKGDKSLIAIVGRDGPQRDDGNESLYRIESQLNVSALTNIASKMRSDIESRLITGLKRKDEEISMLQNNMTKLEKAMRSKHAEFEDRDFRLSLIENSNHDGSMIWKIPQFSQRMADAQSGRYTSIFSLPFNSGRYGYKMCLRLYILGDGIGKNTHMSLFFVIMKGEFDNILPWPFTSKVTFKLINQTGNRDIIDTFQPDPMSSSFQKPKSDMNIASGCPRFVSHTELKSGGFIVDDTVFVKCSIDCATIKHP